MRLPSGLASSLVFILFVFSIIKFMNAFILLKNKGLTLRNFGDSKMLQMRRHRVLTDQLPLGCRSRPRRRMEDILLKQTYYQRYDKDLADS